MSYSSEVLADSPLAYWRLGEASGSATAVDSSGNGHNGTYVGSPTLGAAGLLTGDSNTAMLTTANVSQYMNVPAAAWMNLNTVTIEGWAQFTSYDSPNGDPLCSRYTPGDNYPMFLGRAYGGSRAANAQLLVGGTRYSLTGPQVFDNTTHHFALTYDGTTIRLYLDGSQVATQAVSGTIGWSTSPFEIARYSQTTTTVPGAVIDEVAIYGTALSATRILAHYNAGTTAPSPSANVNAPAASATASALAPSVRVDATIAPPAATASASAPTPSVTAPGDAAIAAPAASATASALPPTVAADSTLAVTAATASAAALVPTVALGATIAAPFAAASAAAVAPFVDNGSGSQTITPPAASATADALAPLVLQIIETSTNTSNNRHGRRRLGFATVTVTRPVAAPPDTLTLATKVDKAVAYPAPTMVNGRPT